MDLWTTSDDDLADEMERRLVNRGFGLCDICGAALGSEPPCAHPARHALVATPTLAAGERYRGWRGDVLEVLGLVIDGQTGLDLVLYRTESGRVYVRAPALFLRNVERLSVAEGADDLAVGGAARVVS